MDHNKIQSVLQDALEEEIPPSQIDLWPAVKANLLAGKLQPRQQGEKMNTTKMQRIPRLAFVIVLIATMLTIFLVTPQGRTFAQSVIQFFTRAESRTFPVSPSQLEASEPDRFAPTVMPPAPLISVSEAEARAGFEAAELPFIPEGFNYLGARLYGNTINVEYETQDKGGHLIISQSQEGFLESDWDQIPAGDQIPADTVTPVKIGELEGEFAQGMFVLYPNDTSATWKPKADILRLRWEKEGTWFEITKYGDAEAIEYLDQAVLIELAESLVSNP
jgi:hypothetical protein